MPARTIDVHIEGRVGRLTLRRPDAGNAFTGAMMVQFADAMRQAHGATDVVTIAAEGDDFCLGRDRTEPKGSHTPFDAFRAVTAVNASLADYPGLILSLIQGRAFGFGVGLAMRTDIAIAAADARFALDEVKSGIPPMFIMAEILDHLPPKIAFDMIMSSREVDAREALEIGLVSRIVGAAELNAAGDELARQLSTRDPAVILASKQYLKSIRRVPADARASYALVAQTEFALAAPVR
jgi:enoyl-CoA hydratase/carnithine racemase